MIKFKYPHTQQEVDANQWEKTTEERSYEMLCSLPPERLDGPAFAVGEPSSHLNNGEPVHDMFICVDNEYYHRPMPLNTFDKDAYTEQVRKQLKG